MLHSRLALDPFDEGYIEDTVSDFDLSDVNPYRVPMPDLEMDAECPTIVGYPVPPLPEPPR